MIRSRILGLTALLAIPFVGAAPGHAARPSQIVFSADRAPLVSYEVYRLDPNGHRVNLSRSPAEDSLPVVSPDGKEVAFFSYRDSAPGQAARIVEVDIDGTHLRSVAPSLDANSHAGSIAWQPHGDRLAAITDTYGGPEAVWILRSGHKPQRVASGGVPEPVWSPPSWSPDGRVLAEWSNHAWRGFSPSGKRLWMHQSRNWGGCCGSSWSSQRMFAITTRSQIRVYGESGPKRFVARVPKGPVSPPAWSPSGQEVAVVAGGVVEVRTAKGRLVLSKRLLSLEPHKPNLVVWAGDGRLVAGLPVTGPQEGVDVRTGKLWTASGRWFDPRSADGKLAIVTPPAGANFAVGVAPVGGGPVKSYGVLPACVQAGPPVSSLQFVGRGRSLVYATQCVNPFSDLFAIAPDGTGLHEISAIQPNAGEPVLSPDDTKIAYTWKPSTGLGGPEIRVANADGTEVRVLASPNSDCTYDASPAWSPDGKTILYSVETIGYTSACPGDSGSELYTVPAAGGAPRDFGVAGSSPIWGPTRIAYQRAGDGALMTANPDGSDPVVVAQTSGTRAWSPDGRLAYATYGPGTTVVVGSTQVQLPFVQLTSLAWSPDGTRFVVTAQKTQNAPFDVYTVNTDGSDPIRLTKNYDAVGASWR